MDGGAHHALPMFDGTGYTFPAGFPKGLTSNTNGKIIACRVYFRNWDPPAAGDEDPGLARTARITVRTPPPPWRAAKCWPFMVAPTVTISGVAPNAYVMSYRVFYNSITTMAPSTIPRASLRWKTS